MHQGVTKFWIIASLLAVLTACTTLPSPDSSPLSSPSRPAAKAAVKPETPGPLVGAAPLFEPVADDTDLLAGESARELERGQASWYGPHFQGRRTASGERYDMHALTAAHKTLPFGTVVRVRGLLTGREIDVRINDRGPFIAGRVIDVSRAAAEALGMLEFGVKDVLLLVPESTPPVVASAPRKSGKAVRRVTKRPAAPTRPR